MARSPDGRQVCTLRGKDPQEDAQAVIAAIIESDAPLLNFEDAGFVWVDGGELKPVSRANLLQVITRYVCYRTVKHSGAGWEVDYPSLELSDPVLRRITFGRPREEGGGGALEERYPKVRKPTIPQRQKFGAA
jgi:hypothetical protein